MTHGGDEAEDQADTAVLRRSWGGPAREEPRGEGRLGVGPVVLPPRWLRLGALDPDPIWIWWCRGLGHGGWRGIVGACRPLGTMGVPAATHMGRIWRIRSASGWIRPEEARRRPEELRRWRILTT